MPEAARSPEPEKSLNWSSLVLPDALTGKLTNLCRMLQNWEILSAQGIQVPGRILLYGPPGTGKTTIAQTIAQESGLALIASNLFECRSQFLGQPSERVKSLFAAARAKRPCILFVDEFDVSPASQDVFHQEIVMEFLMELDPRRPDDGVFFLAAAIDLAGIHQGLLARFSERIQIPYPDRDERRRILQKFLARFPKDLDVELVSAEIADHPGLKSGRDLECVVQSAWHDVNQRAVIRREDLLRAIKRDA